MVNSHTEMAHILGLRDNPFVSIRKNERWNKFSATTSIKNRYKELTGDPKANLNFHLLDFQFPWVASREISALPNGGYVGFSTSWKNVEVSNLLTNPMNTVSGHAFTLHAIKEGELTHFIYVNRGERHYDSSGKEEQGKDTVTVFSVNNSEADAFAKEMVNAAQSLRARTNISEFLHKHENKKNNALTQKLGKKEQKTGNCTIANSNIAWHLQLASELMQKDNITFEQAYEQTKPAYKAMRVQDRVKAFQYLLNDSFYLSKAAYFYNYIQALESFARKDKKNGQNHIESLVKAATDAKTLEKLIAPLISDDFNKRVEEYIEANVKQIKNSSDASVQDIEQFITVTRKNLHAVKHKVLGHAFQKLPEKTQNELIQKDISLLEYAKPELQKNYLNQDYNKYSLYASEGVKKEFSASQGNEKKEYLERSKKSTRERKASDHTLLSGTEKKEAIINNKLRALYSYASANDQNNVSKAFEELCLACGERRLYLTGNKYSADTQSSRWLIDKISEDSEEGEDLRKMLGIQDKDGVKQRVEEIISNKNKGITSASNHYKNEYHKQVETSVEHVQEDSKSDNDNLVKQQIS